jgi:hypothetical protein
MQSDLQFPYKYSIVFASNVLHVYPDTPPLLYTSTLHKCTYQNNHNARNMNHANNYNLVIYNFVLSDNIHSNQYGLSDTTGLNRYSTSFFQFFINTLRSSYSFLRLAILIPQVSGFSSIVDQWIKFDQVNPFLVSPENAKLILQPFLDKTGR